MRLLIPLVLFISLLQTATAQPLLPCELSLIKHVEATKDGFLDWSGLAADLHYRESATVLVRLPLNGVTQSLASLKRLGLPNSIKIEVPPQFMVLADGSLVAIIQGDRAYLIQAQSFLAQRYSGLQFQIIGSKVSTRSFTLRLPERTIEVQINATSEDIKKEIAAIPSQRAILYDIKSGQMVFVLSSDKLNGLTDDILQKVGVQRVKIGDLLAWMRSLSTPQQALLTKWNDHYVLTQKAFSALKQIEGAEIEMTLATTVQVSDELRHHLALCNGFVCQVATPQVVAPTPAAPEIAQADAGGSTRFHTSAEFQMVADFLQTEISEYGISRKNSVQDKFATMIQRVATPQALDGALAELNSIGIKGSDGNNARYPSHSQTRFFQAWTLFASLLRPDWKTLPVTTDSIEQVIRAYREHQHPVAAATLVLETAPTQAPAHAPAPAPAPPTPRPIAVAIPSPQKLLEELPTDSSSLTSVVRERMLFFLGEMIRLKRIDQEGGMERSFFDSLSPLWASNRTLGMSYIGAIKAIQFKPSDYNQIMFSHNRTAELRMTKGWRLLQKLLGDPQLAMPLTLETVDQTIELYLTRRDIRGIFQGLTRRPGPNTVAEAPRRTTAPSPTLQSARAHAQTLTLTPEGKANLQSAGANPMEIADIVRGLTTDWHGITISGKLPGHGGQVQWTVLISSAEAAGWGYQRDKAFVAVIENGKITKVFEDERAEKVFYRIAAEQLGLKTVQVSWILKTREHVETLAFDIDGNVAAKLHLKHKLETATLAKWKVVEVDSRDGNCYNFHPVGEGATARNFRMCIALSETEMPNKLMTLFPATVQ